MGLLRAALLLASLMVPGFAFAGPDRASILIGSRHIGADGFNEDNLGVFLTWENSRVDWSAGLFKNSYNRTSVAVTAAFPLIEWVHGEASVFAGVAHYPDNGRDFAVSIGDFVPIGGLQVRHGSFFGQLIPMDGRPVDALVSFGLTFSLN